MHYYTRFQFIRSKINLQAKYHVHSRTEHSNFCAASHQFAEYTTVLFKCESRHWIAGIVLFNVCCVELRWLRSLLSFHVGPSSSPVKRLNVSSPLLMWHTAVITRATAVSVLPLGEYYHDRPESIHYRDRSEIIHSNTTHILITIVFLLSLRCLAISDDVGWWSCGARAHCIP